MPKPMTAWTARARVASTRMPNILAPSNSTSFGHFSHGRPSAQRVERERRDEAQLRSFAAGR
ncbi:MAG: hypothetical protein QM722_01590 [Piscinibacter sp.]